MGFSGRLEGIAPSDIFQIISQSRMTGTLIARCQEGTAMVVFKDGQVIEAASDAPRESLGSLVVSQGLMSEETIETARDRRKQEPDRPLGAFLVEMGAISQQTLDAVVVRQIGSIVHRLVACEDGFFTFDSGENALKRKLNTHEFFLPAGVSAEFLMMERVRALDEERRTGTDRRAHPRPPAAESEPTRESLRAAREEVRAAPPAFLRTLLEWFRSIRIPKAEPLHRAASAMLVKGKELTASMGSMVRRHALPRLQSAWSTIRAFSPDGRAMIYAGSGGIAAGAALILLFTVVFPSSGNDLVITGKVVNIRAKPTTKADVVAKAAQGDRVSPLSFAKGWHEVRTGSGETGWIWKSLVERRESGGPAVGAATVLFGLVLIAGTVLLIVGILRKRKASPEAPGILRKEV